MTTRHVRYAGIAAICTVLSAWPCAAATHQEQSASAEDALRAFHHRVNEYAALHRRLEGPLPPRAAARESFSTLVKKLYLASAIRKSRAAARPGDIIDPAAEWVFRAIIADAYAGQGGAALAEPFRQQAAHPGPAPLVNEPYPMDASAIIPEPILRRLPALAGDMEYRAANADLILWDVHAEIVVDVLPGAFLSNTSS